MQTLQPYTYARGNLNTPPILQLAEFRWPFVERECRSWSIKFPRSPNCQENMIDFRNDLLYYLQVSFVASSANQTAKGNYETFPLVMALYLRLEPVTDISHYFADGWIELCHRIVYNWIGIVMIFRPFNVRQPATKDERMRAQAIVEKYGHTSMAPCTLFEDKSYFFSPNESVIAFVVKGGIALALGDPIGLETDVEPSIIAFKGFCAHNGWQACFYQVQPDYLKIYKAAGFNAISIGQEAILDFTTSTVENKAGKKIRNVMNRLTRLGHRVEIYDPPLSDALLGELRTISDEWLAEKKGSEPRFSVGWFDDNYIRFSTVAAVYTPEGTISAFTNIVSMYQSNGAAFDLMRRRCEIKHSTMELLFLFVFDWAKKKKYATFSLGFSPLSGIGERPDDPVIEKALHYFYENFSRLHFFKGLHTFKDKFHPRWEKRYMIYPGATSLPAIAIGLARAHNGDDFVRKYIKQREVRPEQVPIGV